MNPKFAIYDRYEHLLVSENEESIWLPEIEELNKLTSVASPILFDTIVDALIYLEALEAEMRLAGCEEDELDYKVVKVYIPSSPIVFISRNELEGDLEC